MTRMTNKCRELSEKHTILTIFCTSRIYVQINSSKRKVRLPCAELAVGEASGSSERGEGPGSRAGESKVAWTSRWPWRGEGRRSLKVEASELADGLDSGTEGESVFRIF